MRLVMSDDLLELEFFNCVEIIFGVHYTLTTLQISFILV